jgi:hypothetical protein
MDKDINNKEPMGGRSNFLNPERREPVLGAQTEQKEIVGEKEFLREKEPITVEELKQAMESREEKPEVVERIKESARKANEAKDNAGKRDRLLKIAEEKGLFFAINVAKEMDPFILDDFHDFLSQESYYQRFKR